MTAPLEAAHPGQSAFRLVSEGIEAFASRVTSARLAERSLDVQIYIWHADLTGAFFAQELLQAADRGVKVRLLLDDLDAREKNDAIAALAAHPRVEVRLFNPFSSRSGALSKLYEALTSFRRINRRMHNKSWIADNRIAIAGGRNIGDEYFGASEDVNFVDLDFAMFGPVVRDATASFERYWNSDCACPIEKLDADAVNADALAKLRGFLAEHAASAQGGRYAAALRADEGIRRMLTGDWPVHWSANYRFVADDPAKVRLKRHDPRAAQVAVAMLSMARSAREKLSVISPYFVPGRQVAAALRNMAAAGCKVGVLTNSLVANDVAVVHGGYSRYRRRLVRGGVLLWELKPLNAHKAGASMFGSSGSSLHTKAIAVDSRTLFVGSYNLDPRSTWLNCEQGVLVDNESLARQLEQIFALQTSAARAWRVTMNGVKLHWSDGQEEFDSDPKAPVSRRFQAWLARVLHLDAQL